MAEKRRFLMYFSYIGTGFRGSQYQWCKETGTVYNTIQHSVEEGLKHICHLKGERPIIITLCSRTDSGVHALKTAFHVDLPTHKKCTLNPILIKHKLNKHFGRSSCIRILDVIHVPDTFNIRKACLSKTYLYRIGVVRECYDEKQIRLFKECVPITEVHRTFFLFDPTIDMKKAEEAAELFVGEKDFAALNRKPSKNIRPTVCNILSLKVEKAQPFMPNYYEEERYEYYHFVCTGTRFLFHMVRCMVGAIIAVARGRLSLDEVRNFFEKPEPSSWISGIVVVPPYGLYLADTVLDKKIITEQTVNETPSEKMSDENKTSAEAA